jgi:hypothetical protein
MIPNWSRIADVAFSWIQRRLHQPVNQGRAVYARGSAGYAASLRRLLPCREELGPRTCHNVPVECPKMKVKPVASETIHVLLCKGDGGLRHPKAC